MRNSNVLSMLAVGILLGSSTAASAAPGPDKNNKKDPAAQGSAVQPDAGSSVEPGEDQEKGGGKGKKGRKKAAVEQGEPAVAASAQPVAPAPVVAIVAASREQKRAELAPVAPEAVAPEPAPDPAAPAAPQPQVEVAVPTFQVTGRIVSGERAGAQKVAVVDIGRAFDKIPAYQKLKKEDLKNTKARYHFLVAEANQKFRVAVDLVAARESFDLVVEKGGVKGLEAIDITDKVVEALQ